MHMGEKVDIMQDYLITKLIGEGGCAKVYLAEHKATLNQVAIKIIDKENLDEKELLGIKNEIKILTFLDHPNIVKMIDHSETRKNFYIVLEYMEGGELFDRIIEDGSFSESCAVAILKILVEVIKYCHSFNVVHRDLKPENILFESDGPNSILKIADFGVSRILTNPKEMLSTVVGSTSYQAPEVIIGDRYSPNCDIYALGIIFYILLCGFPPFDDENHAEFNKNIMSGVIPFPSPEWDSISEEAKDLIRKMVHKNPQVRLSASQVLEHPLMKITHSSTQSTRIITNLKQHQNKRRLKRSQYAVYAVGMLRKFRKF